MKTATKITAIIFSVLFIMSAAVPAFALTNIEEVKLTIAEPAEGEHPSFEITSADTGKYTAKAFVWYLDDGKRYPDLKADDVFEAGKSYRCRIIVNAMEGYGFNNVDQNNESLRDVIVTVNGKRCIYAIAVEDETTLYREATFSVPGSSDDSGSFFENLINTIKGLFERIADFFRNLFSF